uniref:diacylglycerol/lipid kinase family protein n=1 Tax=Acetatifactor sp. TaxID=1872090 RepID=UPI004057992A
MYHIIINPMSRSGKGLTIWEKEVEPAMHAAGVQYRSYFSRNEGHVARIIKDVLSTAKERPVNIILLGGDGTVNEAIQEIDDTSDVVFGYIPTGSSNDLARDLQIPTEPVKALEFILHKGKIHTMDLGTITYDDGHKRRFVVSCGIGFDAAVCEEALHSNIKKAFNKIGLGKLTYLGIALKQLFAAKSVSCQLTLDDDIPINIRKLLFVTCMQHRYEGGGFMFCPTANASDGYLDLCVVGDVPKLLILFALPTAFKGKHYFVKGITAHRAKKVRIETSTKLWVHTDGEVCRQTDAFTVTCKQHAIKIIGI